MSDELIELKAKPPGLALRTLSLVAPSVRKVTSQIEPYTSWWNQQNRKALQSEGPLLVVIGDSTAIGVGASDPSLGYVPQLVQALTDRDGTESPWRVVNLAQSGAKTTDGLKRQLPAMKQISERTTIDLSFMCIGTNDVVWSTDTNGTRSRIKQLIDGLGSPSAACVVAGTSPRARLVNRAIRSHTKQVGTQLIEPWNEPGPGALERLASDRFHPNDLGYALMAKAITRQLGMQFKGTGFEQKRGE